MSSIAEYKPSAVQSEFHTNKCNEILFAGSAGPGKSWALLWDPILNQAIEERARWSRGEINESEGWSIYFRRTTKRLLEAIKRAKQLYPVIFPGIKWDGDNLMFIDPCGYRFQFAHMQHEENAEDHKSSSYTALYFDEATEFTEEQFSILSARVRSSDPVLRNKLRICLASNPGPGWVKKRFVDPAPEGRRILTERFKRKTGETVEYTRTFIPATLYDNPDKEFVKEYETALLAKPAHIREAWLNGRWNYFASSFFADTFFPEKHVIDPFIIPQKWLRFRTMDWGFKTNGIIQWWASDGDSNMVCYREYSFKGKDSDQVALAVRDIEIAAGEWNMDSDCSKLRGPADTQIWEERGNTGPTIYEGFANYGVWWDKCTKGAGSRKRAANEIARRLNMPVESKDDRPNIAWFTTCKKSIDIMSTVPASTEDIEEPLKDGTTHALDTTMYAVMYPGVFVDFEQHKVKKRDIFDTFDELGKKRAEKQRGAWGYGHG